MEKNYKFFNLKTGIEFTSKYWAQILFIPLLLGGLVQVINLLAISPQALRFFSSTQAIADGIVILSICIMFIVSFIILIIIVNIYGAIITDPNRETIKQWEERKGVRYKTLLERIPRFVNVLLLFLCLYCYYILFNTLPETLKIRDISVLEIIYYASFAIIFNFMITNIILRFIFWKQKYYIQDNRKIFVIIFLLINFITIFVYIFLSSNGNTILNLNKIQNKYCCESTGTLKIIYFNDKYIFIESKCRKEKKEIIIEKIDIVFE